LNSHSVHFLFGTRFVFYFIVSDSLASLKAISYPSTANPLIARIQILLEACTTASIQIVFIWVPGHSGIRGNEKVNKAAKQASQQPHILKSLLPSNSDLFHHINKYIQKKWLNSWKNEYLKGNKLTPLKESPIPWTSSNLQTKSQEITPFSKNRISLWLISTLTIN